ncbi:MAG TPA: hypothetical protein VFA16_10305, partial [Mycobacterium sp.]|uniref:hypothetical protein n=1 Tax=Mycobacterium sp. TaxID=1785 RepID=UPI002D75DC58
MATRILRVARRLTARRRIRVAILGAVAVAGIGGALGAHADSLVGTGHPWKSPTLPLHWPHAASGSASWSTGGSPSSLEAGASVQASIRANQTWQQAAAQAATSGWCMEPSANNPTVDCSMIPSTLAVSIDGFTLPTSALAMGVKAAANDLGVPASSPTALSTGVALAVEKLMESQEAVRQQLVADPATVQNLLDWQLQ